MHDLLPLSRLLSPGLYLRYLIPHSRYLAAEPIWSLDYFVDALCCSMGGMSACSYFLKGIRTLLTTFLRRYYPLRVDMWDSVLNSVSLSLNTITTGRRAVHF